MDFHDCLLECCLNDEFVKEFNRLTNCHIDFHDRRTPIEKMIDDVTKYPYPFKNNSDEINMFFSFVFEFVWLPLLVTIRPDSNSPLDT